MQFFVRLKIGTADEPRATGKEKRSREGRDEDQRIEKYKENGGRTSLWKREDLKDGGGSVKKVSQRHGRGPFWVLEEL